MAIRASAVSLLTYRLGLQIGTAYVQKGRVWGGAGK